MSTTANKSSAATKKTTKKSISKKRIRKVSLSKGGKSSAIAGKKGSETPKRVAAPDDQSPETATGVQEQQKLLQEKIRKLTKLAKEQGHVTYEDFDEAFPEAINDLDSLESIMSQLRALEIDIIESSKVAQFKAQAKEKFKDIFETFPEPHTWEEVTVLLKGKIRDALENVTEQERQSLEQRFGLVNENSLTETFEKVGHEVKVLSDRIHLLEAHNCNFLQKNRFFGENGEEIFYDFSQNLNKVDEGVKGNELTSKYSD